MMFNSISTIVQLYRGGFIGAEIRSNGRKQPNFNK